MSKAGPPWMTTARNCIGIKEYPGAPSNPVIMEWARRTARYLGIRYDGDHVPWCGLFAAFVVVENNIIPPSIAVRASEWGKWGVALQQPSFGAIMVFTRNGGGHVGFYVSEDATHYHILGGNQSDSVNIMKLAKSRLTNIRWPAGVPLPKTGPIVRVFNGAISTNEA
jgi:uncharacterized protein (TIGR02594 family)